MAVWIKVGALPAADHAMVSTRSKYQYRAPASIWVFVGLDDSSGLALVVSTRTVKARGSRNLNATSLKNLEGVTEAFTSFCSSQEHYRGRNEDRRAWVHRSCYIDE